MNKRILVAVLILGMAVIAAPAAEACPKSHMGDYQKKKGIKEKFFHKAHTLLKNQDELKLTEKQVTTIKNLKRETQKDLILKEAEIEILAIDIRSKLWEDDIDVEAINLLIDKKYTIKKDKSKALVSAFAQVEKALTEDQKENLKSMRKGSSVSKGSHSSLNRF